MYIRVLGFKFSKIALPLYHIFAFGSGLRLLAFSNLRLSDDAVL